MPNRLSFCLKLVATTLIQFNNEKNGNDNTASFLEELFEKRSSAFASTIASAMSDSARVLLENNILRQVRIGHEEVVVASADWRHRV